MPIKFTKHALEQMLFREITKDEIIEVVNNPEKVIEGIGSTKIAQRLIDDKLLRVYFRSEGKDKIIITAYKTSKLERYA